MATETNEFIPTRRSLITRLKNWNDQDGWQRFFDTYWRMIYSVARRSGLSDAFHGQGGMVLVHRSKNS